ncbi:hypothetical protein Q0590_26560 [Rhodocytophaga aerolata]|uniref:Uncharacterized protein n=1 Tax=Rhodocytophaga aerolata TaxID=455078 RepID=A0ABT8RCQ3_9BACT|nr:hypothetical protein [Rhodocytophaga aerolata]MDO1449870.1 hypothetical protein [Rhodocytophaga aerolata]
MTNNKPEQDFSAMGTPLQSSINSESNRYDYTIDELKQIPNWQNLSEGEIQMHFSKIGAQKQEPLSDPLDTSAQNKAGMSRENLNLSRE